MFSESTRMTMDSTLVFHARSLAAEIYRDVETPDLSEQIDASEKLTRVLFALNELRRADVEPSPEEAANADDTTSFADEGF